MLLSVSDMITSQKTLKGADIITNTLKGLGVDTIFGYPGGIVLEIYDSLLKQKDIKHYLMRHEQSATHAAEGYARVSGKCGVVLVTSGPGATNTITGIANAYLDGYPLVILTGQVSSNLTGKNSFQEVNIVEIAKPCTKAVFQITRASDIQSTLQKAFKISTSGKKGPVLVDLTKNIFSEDAEFLPINQDFEPTVNKNYNVKKILTMLSSAKKPVMLAGGGVTQSNSADLFNSLAELLNIPTVTTMMGLGVNGKNNFGMVGIFGKKSANKLLAESDLILSAGARFNDRITCCFKNGELDNKIIQLDINPDEIGINISPVASCVCDLREFLSGMLNELKIRNYQKNSTSWLDTAKSFNSLDIRPQKLSNELNSFEVLQKINEFIKDKNLYVSTEVGQHQLFTAQNFDFQNTGKFLTSGGLGTMGFGLPAAIGASISQGGSEVVCISGDGSFQMSMHELATCKDYDLPVKIFILNNGYLGMVRQLQQKFCDGRYFETKISNPDFIKVAQSYGIDAWRVSRLDEITPALEKAFRSKSTTIVEFIIEPMEVVS